MKTSLQSITKQVQDIMSEKLGGNLKNMIQCKCKFFYIQEFRGTKIYYHSL